MEYSELEVAQTNEDSEGEVEVEIEIDLVNLVQLGGDNTRFLALF